METPRLSLQSTFNRAPQLIILLPDCQSCGLVIGEKFIEGKNALYEKNFIKNLFFYQGSLPLHNFDHPTPKIYYATPSLAICVGSKGVKDHVGPLHGSTRLLVLIF